MRALRFPRFRGADPHLAAHYYVNNDSPGSIFTASGDKGGVVIISGTGSMSEVIDAEGRSFTCGGWGHMFGDGASSCAALL